MRQAIPYDAPDYDARWLERTLARTVASAGGCLWWAGPTTGKGYAITSYRGKSGSGHRLVYQAKHGVVLAADQFVCHTCDNRRCINPDHLWLGNAKDNNTDSARKKRHYYAAKTHCPRGHEYPVESTFLIDRKPRNCVICQRIRLRIKAGWPKELAETMEPQTPGKRPVNASWAGLRK